MTSYYVYIMTNKPFGTLYIGVANDLVRRVWEHRQGLGSKFVKKYNLHHLIYTEEYSDVLLARQRERTMKHWKREWKIKLISEVNPEWEDLIPMDTNMVSEIPGSSPGKTERDSRVRPEENRRHNNA